MTYKRAKIESSRTKTNYESVFVGRAIQLGGGGGVAILLSFLIVLDQTFWQLVVHKHLQCISESNLNISVFLLFLFNISF